MHELQSIWTLKTVEFRLFTRGVQAQYLWCMGSEASRHVRLSVPWPGLEPSSLALEGRFLTTGPPRKSLPWSSFSKKTLAAQPFVMFSFQGNPGEDICACIYVHNFIYTYIYYIYNYTNTVWYIYIYEKLKPMIIYFLLLFLIKFLHTT